PPSDLEPLLDEAQEYYQEEYEVEKILRHKKLEDGSIRFFVKWVGTVGFPTSKGTWQTESDLENAPERVQEYWASKSKSGHA
ncbi:hypothetical protein BGZ80_008244, partial [Entomortierella chlamydospora]